MNRRRKRRLPFAAYAALIFNASLCVTPFMAAHVISTAYGDKKPAFEATPEAIAATRQAMDARFQQISVRNDATPRQVWSGLVRTSLEDREMRLVRGLMLGAPAMLNGPDGDALRARIAVADGNGEQALIDAAVSYLPEDLQDEYERRTQSILSMFSASAPASALKDVTPAVATSAPASATASAAEDDDATSHIEINRLGDIRQLTMTAVGWARDDSTDVDAFLISGIGLILADAESREGASVAISTLRTRTEGGVPFKRYLERRLEETVPINDMKRLLSAEFQNEIGYTPRNAEVVERVFRTTIDKQKLQPLLAEFRILREIARDTSHESAVAIVSRVRDGVDLRRASLVAQAGGDRAVALEHFDGDNLLDTARTTITWTNALRIQVAGLAACLLLLGFVALSVFWKSFRRNRPVKKSAVYLMEEHPA